MPTLRRARGCWTRSSRALRPPPDDRLSLAGARMSGDDAARGGYVALPHALLDLAARELTAQQERLLLRLLQGARWEPGTVTVRGNSIALDRGEQLTSLDGLATKYR